MFRMYLDVDMSFVVFIIIKYKGSDKVRIPVLEVIILAVKDLSEEKHKWDNKKYFSTIEVIRYLFSTICNLYKYFNEMRKINKSIEMIIYIFPTICDLYKYLPLELDQSVNVSVHSPQTNLVFIFNLILSLPRIKINYQN